MKLLAFLLCAACFFGLFGLEYFFLLRPSRRWPLWWSTS